MGSVFEQRFSSFRSSAFPPFSSTNGKSDEQSKNLLTQRVDGLTLLLQNLPEYSLTAWLGQILVALEQRRARFLGDHQPLYRWGVKQEPFPFR